MSPPSPRYTHENNREPYPPDTDNRLIGISDGVTIHDSATMILHFVCILTENIISSLFAIVFLFFLPESQR
jgi:hypothetical protein